MKENKLSLVELVDTLTPEKTWRFDEVSPGKRVTMYFSLALLHTDDASRERLIDSNFDKTPATFIMGDGNLLAGFERAILGLQAGDENTFNIACENAFGQFNEDNIQIYPRYQFSAELLLEKGLMINFADAAGNDQPGVVKAFDAENVTVDFNHPLAGKNIQFKVKIMTVAENKAENASVNKAGQEIEP